VKTIIGSHSTRRDWRRRPVLSYRLIMTRTLFMIILGSILSSLAIGQGVPPSHESSNAPIALSRQTGALRIGVVGMVHGHVEGILSKTTKQDNITIVGIVETDQVLFKRLADNISWTPACALIRLRKCSTPRSLRPLA